MTLPAEKALALIDEINSMIPFDGSEERLTSLETQIAAIERAGCSYQAWLLQGMIAALRGDVETVHAKFRAALRASGDELIVSLNYAQALCNLRHLREAIVQVDSIIPHAPDDLCILNLALNAHLEAYDVLGTERIVEMITRLGAEDTIAPDLEGKLMYLKSEMENSDVKWLDVAQRIELVTGVLQSMGVFGGTMNEECIDHGIHLEFEVRGDLDTAYRAENAIHIAIASQPYSSADRFISFACAPA